MKRKPAIPNAAKLNPDQVQEIRLSTEPAKVLAYRYGVQPACIYFIRNRTTWKHLEWPEEARA